ncbi:MAG: PA0069 family radical SAM protein [Gammaproteobacteria bacterium WSBS_2016_MAG_OTU1]
MTTKVTKKATNTKHGFAGRGAVGTPAGRFDSTTTETFDDGWDNDEDCAPPPQTLIHWDKAKSIISENSSPDIPHQLSSNPYRGCEHGCIYCFARPSHAYLGLSPGLDFETQLFAKKDAAILLQKELSHPNYRPRPLSLGINTDAYQPIEKRLQITRQMLEILAQCRHPVSLITKSALIERDLDILSAMAKDNLVEVAVSLTSLNTDLTRKLEPRAAAPTRRLKIIEHLAAAGIPTTALIAPIIPALTDSEIESLLSAAANAGATSAGYVILRLPHELKTVFNDWLSVHFPQRQKKIMAQVRDLHGGKEYNPEYFARHRGRGILADLIASRFNIACRRHSLTRPRHTALRCDLFIPPIGAQQKLI